MCQRKASRHSPALLTPPRPLGTYRRPVAGVGIGVLAAWGHEAVGTSGAGAGSC
ncbi:MAG: hypothetical protein MUC60_19500 [Oscillatoria sp. Prado101]|nr:hypothetical protein [Oscillatoria sp. Prado101]